MGEVWMIPLIVQEKMNKDWRLLIGDGLGRLLACDYDVEENFERPAVSPVGGRNVVAWCRGGFAGVEDGFEWSDGEGRLEASGVFSEGAAFVVVWSVGGVAGVAGADKCVVVSRWDGLA